MTLVGDADERRTSYFATYEPAGLATEFEPNRSSADVRGMVRFLRRHGCSQGQALTLGGVAETFVALNRGPRVWAMEIWSRGRR